MIKIASMFIISIIKNAVIKVKNIKITSILIIASILIITIILTIAFMKQQTKNAVIKAREEERLVCENMITSANLNSQKQTIKTIVKYEKIKSNVSTYDINERSRLLQQIEDFNFAD